MKSAAKNIQLASYDDLFKTDEERQADAQERVQSLPLDRLMPFQTIHSRCWTMRKCRKPWRASRNGAF